ncbi:hypothetical protein D3C72_1221210 [compost metagenome]
MLDAAQPFGADIAERAAFDLQGAAGQDAALVVDDVAGQACIAAHDDLARIALRDPGFLRDLGHLVEGEVLDHPVVAEVGVEGADLFVQRFVQFQVMIVGGLLLGQVIRTQAAAIFGQWRLPDARGALHLKDRPDLGVAVVMELGRIGVAIARLATIAAMEFRRVRQADGRAYPRPAFLVALDVAVVKRRPVLAFRILRRWHQQAPFVEFPHPAGVAPANGLDGVAEPHALAVHDFCRAVQAVVPLGLPLDLGGFAGEMIVQVFDESGGNVGVACHFDRGRLVDQGLRHTLRPASRVQPAAQTQISCREDQGVFLIGQGAYAQVHVAARCDHRIGVIQQGRGLDSHPVAIDATGVAHVARFDARIAAIDKARVGERAGHVQQVVANGDDFAAFPVGQTGRVEGQVPA